MSKIYSKKPTDAQEDFCPEMHEQELENMEYYYRKAKRLERWRKRHPLSEWIDNQPWL